jgi:hypothetical protein
MVRITNGGTVKKTDVEKETSDPLVLRTERGKCFLWDNSESTYVDYSSGNVIFMDGSSDYIYIGTDEIIRNINFEFSTPGSYTGVNFKYSSEEDENTFTVLPGDSSDGTSALTANGVLFLGTITPALWKKTTINGYRMYWIRIGCTAKTTQAEADVLHWTWAYDYPHHFLLGEATVHTKSDGATPVYNDITSNIVYDYPNMGMVVFDENPIEANPTYSIVAEYSYKLPQMPEDGIYTLSFPSESTCEVNGGAAKGITPNDVYIHRDLVDGLEIVLRSGLEAGNEAEITISDALKWSWYADDDTPTEWQNKDLELPATGSGLVSYFYYKQCPPVSVVTADNTRGVEAFFYQL